MKKVMNKRVPESAAARFFNASILAEALDSPVSQIEILAPIINSTVLDSNTETYQEREVEVVEKVLRPNFALPRKLPSTEDVLEVKQPPITPHLPAPAVQPVKGPVESVRRREFLLTRRDEELIDDLRYLFRQRTGTPVNATNVLRAIFDVVREHLPSIREEATRLVPISRPAARLGVGKEMDEFEGAIASALKRGLRG